MIDARKLGLVRIFALAGGAAIEAMAVPSVAVDVGHTVAAQGAVSARGRSEFEFNRELALRLMSALTQRGIQVVPVNFDGQVESLPARPRLATGTDFFVFIHHDSVQPHLLKPWVWEGRELTYSEAKRGFGLFVSAANPEPEVSLACASAMGARLRRLGFFPAPQHGAHRGADSVNGVWYYDNLVVLYRTTLPAVLFEAGVIKHPAEELELADLQRQDRMADALATGIAACLQIRGKPARE